MSEEVNKAFGLPEGIDPNHEYVYRSGCWDIYDFWYVDKFGNYWLYTNAPDDHKDFVPEAGEAILVADQPMPHTAPQFYTPDGRKLHIAVPEGANLIPNEAYNPEDPQNIWIAMYTMEDKGETRFVYLDADVRENLDLWMQYQLRITDAMLVRFRIYANKLFNSAHPKDRVFGAMMMLLDQGVYDAHDLIDAKVEDLEFIDSTVKLLSKKLVCDPFLLDFFSSITVDRDPSEPLFVIDTHMGREAIGRRHIYSFLKALRINSGFFVYWHASHLYSRIVHRMAANGVEETDVEEMALNELQRALNTLDDPEPLVDLRLRQTLRRNYVAATEEDSGPQALADLQNQQEEGDGEEEAPEEMGKSLSHVTTDDFGVFTIFSDLIAKRPDELAFSVWLHGTPLHDVSEEEMEDIEAQIQQPEEEPDPTAEETASEAPEEEPEESEEGAVEQPDAAGAGGAPAEGDIGDA